MARVFRRALRGEGFFGYERAPHFARIEVDERDNPDPSADLLGRLNECSQVAFVLGVHLTSSRESTGSIARGSLPMIAQMPCSVNCASTT